MKLLVIFWQFLILGCISFGGPAAHIGYFQKTFVQKLKWVDAKTYARLLSLCQFLPGPASSQMGFSIGLQRGGIVGGAAAFMGFTLPSFLIMYFLSYGNASHDTNSILYGISHGLKIMAVVIVADATMSMYTTFCKEKKSSGIAFLTAAILLICPGIWSQGGVLAVAALYGYFRTAPESHTERQPVKIKLIPLGLFAFLFIGLPILAYISPQMHLFSTFYQSGSLVFGGGHVVLPLLQHFLGDTVSADRFLLGYAAAQAVPGPMFSFATFLGAELSPGYSLLGAIIATLGIFLPGFLLVLSLHSAWQSLADMPKISGAVWGINASVVGLLMAALYKPVFISAVTSPLEMALVILGFLTLRSYKAPILLLVAAYSLAGIMLV